MFRNAIKVSAIALGLLTTTAAHADNIGILQATLAEANQTTAEVSTEQLRRILTDKSAIVLDTRTRDEFDAGHIPGARNLDAPATGQVAAVDRIVGGNKDAALVLYCNGPFCQASRRLAGQLAAEGFRNVRRYQLGIPVWRALGGPTAIGTGGITRVFGIDRTAVFIDARPASEFASGSVSGAQNAPLEDVISGKVKVALPEDDFNRRIILFGRDAAQARQLADLLSKRPWHNVSYFPGSFEALKTALVGR
jgi:rhodanese-related sulfurtransferase